MDKENEASTDAADIVVRIPGGPRRITIIVDYSGDDAAAGDALRMVSRESIVDTVETATDILAFDVEYSFGGTAQAFFPTFLNALEQPVFGDRRATVRYRRADQYGYHWDLIATAGGNATVKMTVKHGGKIVHVLEQSIEDPRDGLGNRGFWVLA
jgi:hypothetical protein